MRLLTFAVLVFLLTVSCRTLPLLAPLETEREAVIARCLSFIPARAFRMVHSINASLPLGVQSSMLGITVGDPATRRLRAVILSTEGLVLFDAGLDQGRITLHRALPPLDKPAFAEGLFADLGPFLLVPAMKAADIGQDRDGALLCRFRPAKKETLDYLAHGDGTFAIRRFTGRKLLKTVEAGPLTADGFATRVDITVLKPVRYSLSLSLVEGEWIEADAALFTP